MTPASNTSSNHSHECWITQDGVQLAELAYRNLYELLTNRDNELATIALSGGSTPKRLYERMTQDAEDASVWQKAHWFVSDERNVPLDHPDSNFGLADRILFQPTSIPRSLLHPVPIHIDSPATAAAEYETTIESLVPRSTEGRPSFDLIFLGLGDDAHTASLFPGTPALHESTRNVVDNYIPKLSTHRITFTASLINSAKQVVFLVSGSSKTTALEQIWHGPRNIDLYPAQLIAGAKRVIWMIDRAALGSLTPPTHFKTTSL
jgi:6-phosphogluconolactonase